MYDCNVATDTLPLPFSSLHFLPVRPGKCWLSSTSAAVTNSTGRKEEEQSKEGDR
jgi:hypothetical protein